MCARARRLPREERYVASAAVAGGALLAIGAFLPWLTLYAGLHPLRGVIGLNGRVLAAGGAGCLVAGGGGWGRPPPGVRGGGAVFCGAPPRVGGWAVPAPPLPLPHLAARPRAPAGFGA